MLRSVLTIAIALIWGSSAALAQVSGVLEDAQQCGRYDARQAVLYCDRALEHADELSLDRLVNVYLDRAAAFEKLGRHGDALRDVNAALALNPYRIDVYMVRARLSASAGDFEGAIPFYQVVISDITTDGLVRDVARLDLCHAQYRAGQYDAAIETCTAGGLYEADSGEPTWFYEMLGNIELKRGNFSAALEHYEARGRVDDVRRAPVLAAQVYYLMSLAYRGLGQAEKAAEYHDRATHNDPDVAASVYQALGLQ